MSKRVAKEEVKKRERLRDEEQNNEQALEPLMFDKS